MPQKKPIWNGLSSLMGWGQWLLAALVVLDDPDGLQAGSFTLAILTLDTLALDASVPGSINT